MESQINVDGYSRRLFWTPNTCLIIHSPSTAHTHTHTHKRLPEAKTPPATQQHRFHFSSTDTFIGIQLSICTLFLTPPCLSNSLSIYLSPSDYPYLLPVCVLLPLQWRTLAAQGVKWDGIDRSCLCGRVFACVFSECVYEWAGERAALHAFPCYHKCTQNQSE